MLQAHHGHRSVWAESVQRRTDAHPDLRRVEARSGRRPQVSHVQQAKLPLLYGLRRVCGIHSRIRGQLSNEQVRWKEAGRRRALVGWWREFVGRRREGVGRRRERVRRRREGAGRRREGVGVEKEWGIDGGIGLEDGGGGDGCDGAASPHTSLAVSSPTSCLGSGIGVWILLSMVAASMSTGDGAILAMGTVFAHNLVRKLGADLDDAKLLTATRLSTIVWACIAAAIASATPTKTGDASAGWNALGQCSSSSRPFCFVGCRMVTDPTRSHTDPTQIPHRSHTDPTQIPHRSHIDPTQIPHRSLLAAHDLVEHSAVPPHRSLPPHRRLRHHARGRHRANVCGCLLEVVQAPRRRPLHIRRIDDQARTRLPRPHHRIIPPIHATAMRTVCRASPDQTQHAHTLCRRAPSAHTL